MEHNFFHYNFEPSTEVLEAMIETTSGLFEAAGVKIESVDINFDEDDEVLYSISFYADEKYYRFTYDNSGCPCVDICDLDGNVFITLRPKDYNELMESI